MPFFPVTLVYLNQQVYLTSSKTV
uniref:Uncharacterized protein n=1 Tax=Arundo donax TaxID=35708 RepID=A0A0A9AV19_ARUDO